MIDEGLLVTKFDRIGARLRLVERKAVMRWGVMDAPVRFDVRSDGRGEFFEIVRDPDADPVVEVLDVRPGDRHLLILSRLGREKSKFLCGHDERHWFVAAVPESAAVGTVRAAKEALKPAAVLEAQGRLRLGAEARGRRKNAAYRRQGEWFFLPAPGLEVDPMAVLRDEPIVRSNGGKPHRLEFCHRSGGDTVHISREHPQGLTPAEYHRLLRFQPEAKSWRWGTMTRNPTVHARGRVRHADHKTITLVGWHRVVMNTETESKAMRNVVFLD